MRPVAKFNCKSVAMITDTHFGVKNDDPNFIEHQVKFYDEVFFPDLIKRDIKTILHLGDIFDRRKYTNHQTLLAFKQSFFDKLVDHGIHMVLILGNHDVYYKSTNEVNSPELFLSQYRDNITVINHPSIINIGGVNLGMLPWINAKNYEDSLDFMANCGCEILCGHFEINGFAMHRGGTLSKGGLKAEIFDPFEIVFSGHFHEPSSDGRITYLGAPYEYTWADFGCDRGHYIFDPKSHDLEYVKNPDRMYYRITYDELFSPDDYDVDQLEGKIVRVIVADKVDNDRFEQFVEEVQNAGPSNFEIIDNVSYHVDEENLDQEALKSEDTLAIVKSYVNESDIALDKDKINTMFKSLFMEAVATE